jgi:hypothetical protein
MKTINMYEVGEEVLIKASVTDILVENGEIKYRIKAEHSNNDLDHKFTDHQLIPYIKEIPEDEEETPNEDDKEELYDKLYS